MRILVTGSSGFVGSHLVEELVRRKHSVRVLLRPGGAVSPWLTDLDIAPVTAAYSDPTALNKALSGVEMVIHVGGVTKGVTLKDYYEGNAGSTAALLNAIGAMKKRPSRFVLISSHAMMGPAASDATPSREDDVPMPVEAYGQSKLSAELIARSHSHQIPVTIIRPPSVYGPRERDFLELFRQIKRHINLFYGNSRKFTGLVHVKDLVKGILGAAFSPKAANRAYFICSEEGITWQKLQYAIRKTGGSWALTIHIPYFVTRIAASIAGIKMKLTGRPTLVNKQKVLMAAPKYWCLSGKRAAKEIGFKPDIPLEEGLRQTWEWYKKEGWL